MVVERVGERFTAKYRRLWNLTRDKGIARPPTSPIGSAGKVEAPSNGSVNFRAR